jgi:hypothetical protein
MTVKAVLTVIMALKSLVAVTILKERYYTTGEPTDLESLRGLHSVLRIGLLCNEIPDDHGKRSKGS